MKVDSLPRPEPHGQAPTFLLPSYHSLTQGLPVFLFILFFFFFYSKKSTFAELFNNQQAEGVSGWYWDRSSESPFWGVQISKGQRVLRQGATGREDFQKILCQRIGGVKTVPASSVKILGRVFRCPDIRGPGLGPKGDRP